MSIAADKCYKAAFKFKAVLERQLDCDAAVMHTTEDDLLCALLGEEYYTYLMLCHGCRVELVRACVSSGKVYIDREIDKTYARDWPCGTEIYFEPAAQSAMVDALKAADECVPEVPECDEKLYTGMFCIGRFNFRVQDGLITECLPNGRNIANDCFTNPVITFDKNGCIECVAEAPETTLVYRECKR